MISLIQKKKQNKNIKNIYKIAPTIYQKTLNIIYAIYNRHKNT